MILKIVILDDSPPNTISSPRKVVTMGFTYPDYDSTREDFDALCEVFSRMIDYRKRLDYLRKETFGVGDKQ